MNNKKEKYNEDIKRTYNYKKYNFYFEKNYIGIVEDAKNRWHQDKIVTYYEEYNIFAYHKTEKCIKEYYSNDAPSIPKYREYYKIPKKDSIIYYYDEYGNITDIKTYNEDGAIVNK